jgi:hypothetical protein
MKIEKYEVKTFKEVLKCEEKNCDGYLEFTGKVESQKDIKDTSKYITLYEHVCTKCTNSKTIVNEKYPRLVYE